MIRVELDSNALTGVRQINGLSPTRTVRHYIALLSFVPAPSISSLSPTSGAVGATITVLGSNFGSTQGSGTVKFNGTLATTITSWSATSIAVSVPVGATTGNVVVNAAGVASNGKSFTILAAPSVTSLSQNSGTANTQITITGTGFGSSQGSGYVTFGGVSAGIFSWTATSIVAQMSSSTSPGTVQVAVNAAGVSSNSLPFTALPSTASLSPSTGPIGASVVIAGANLGTSGTVTFNGITATTTSWTPTSLTATVPNSATTGNVVVTSNATSSAGVGFTVAPNASVSGISVNSGIAGTSVIISGSNFGSSQVAEAGGVLIGGAIAQTTSWSASSITAVVPSNASPGSGSVVVTLAGSASNSMSFTVVPSTSSLSMLSGGVGSLLSVAGAALGSTQGSSSVEFGGTNAPVMTWGATGVIVQVPNLPVGTVPVTISAAGLTTSPLQFSVAPATDNISPGSGAVGDTVTITGSNLGTSGAVTFNGVTATTTNWSDTSIVAQVPSGATSGPVVATVNGIATDPGTLFVVIPAPNPVTGIAITPNVLSMLSGDSRSLVVVDNNGNNIEGVAWSTSDSNIVSVDQTSGMLTANNAGTTTMTATYQSYTAQAPVTVYAGATFPAGTINWSSQTSSGYFAGRTIQLTPTGTNVADLVVVDAVPSIRYNVSMRALTIDGKQVWTASVDNVDVDDIQPDRLGGLLLPVHVPMTQNGCGVDFKYLVDVNASTGRVRWIHGPLSLWHQNCGSGSGGDADVSSFPEKVAVHPDGTIYAAEHNIFIDKMDFVNSEGHVVALDGATGREKFTVSLPQQPWDSQYWGVKLGAPSLSPFSIMPDGSVYIEAGQQLNPSGAYQEKLYLIKILNDGSSSSQTLISQSGIERYFMGEVIPDGQGGVLASWHQCGSGCGVGQADGGGIFHVDSQGSPHQFNFQLPQMMNNTNDMQMILGDGNAGFLSDSVDVVNFDVNSGVTKWSWQVSQSPQSHRVSLVAATDGGGLVARDTSGYPFPESIVRFDSSGTPTYDTWTTTAAANAGGAALQNLDFVASDAFSSIAVDSSGNPLPQTLMLASAMPLDWAAMPDWVAPPADGASTKHDVTLKAFQVQNTSERQAISTQIDDAVKLWGKRVKGLHLVWDGTITSGSLVPACDTTHYPGGCSAQQTVDTLYVHKTCTATDSISEFVRRFAAPKGLQLVFTNTILILDDNSNADEVDPFDDIPTCSHSGNIVVMANTSEGNILAHGIGHAFQLRHVQGPQNTDNLMCAPGGTGCPLDVPGDKLTVDQVRIVNQGAVQWEP